MFETVKKYGILLKGNGLRKIPFIIIISVINTVLEVLSVSLVIPLVSAILNENTVSENVFVSEVCRIFSITSYTGFVYACIFLLIGVFVFKNVFIVFADRYRLDYVYGLRLKTQGVLLEKVLHRPYEFFIASSTSEVVRMVQTDVANTYATLNTLISIVSETLVSLAVTVYIFIINPKMTLLLTAVLALLVFVFNIILKPILKTKGEKARADGIISHRWLMESVRGIKQIKVSGKEKLFVDEYRDAVEEQMKSLKSYRLYGLLPRLIMEMWCVCGLLVVLAVMIGKGYSSNELIPTISAYGMAAIKLMPWAGHLVSAMNDIAFHDSSIDKLLKSMAVNNEEYKDDNEELTFEKTIELKNISYRYPGTEKYILKNSSMSVPAGKSVGIVGKSGEGKTTLVDIMLTLLNQEDGQILVDGKDIRENKSAWLKKVSYIPQTIFLMDDTIAANVAFGETADPERIMNALKDAQLWEFVEGLKDKVNTRIGEGGIRLSQGQRQRIGIARALYTDPQVLVFDEATSSLDVETEKAVIDTIDALHNKKTMVIIAHRLETIKNCDIVYKVNNTKIEKSSQ